MKLVQVIYASRPFRYDEQVLNGILISARRNNIRDGITGALICREDLFVQLLEGPSANVADTFARIVRDHRHTDVVTLVRSETEVRLFPEWAMRHDPPRSWMWTPEDVAAGLVGAASRSDVRGVFERLAKEQPVTAQLCPATPGART
jgi:Sensors of blue-light using FAD